MTGSGILMGFECTSRYSDVLRWLGNGRRDTADDAEVSVGDHMNMGAHGA